MAKNKEFDDETAETTPYNGRFKDGKVYINLSNIAILNCLGEYTHVTLTNGNDHKFKSERLEILE